MSESSQIESLINQGRYLEARAQAEFALRGKPDSRTQQLYALAVSKAGEPEEARKFLEPIYQNDAVDPETAGILAGVYKELFKKNYDNKFALLSRDTYAKNFEVTKNFYTGINAATMSAIAMQSSKSKILAKEVINLISPDTEDFWELATLGEAYLLIKEKNRSIQEYSKAKKVAGSDWGKIISVHNQLWLLNNFIPVSLEIQNMFSAPGIMAFTGHMIDRPGSDRVRFPESIEPFVKRAIEGTLQTHNVKIGYTSLACGADILFAEALAEQNGEVHIYIPFNIEEFINLSVRFAGEKWVDRFNALIKRFPVNMLTHESYSGHDDLFAIQSKVIFGATLIKTAGYHTSPKLLTVLSEMDLKRLDGGTRDSLSFWPLGQGRININPDAFIPAGTIASKKDPIQPQVVQPDESRPTLYLLSADASALNQLIVEKLLATVKDRVESDAVMFPFSRIDNKKVLVACKTEAVMIEIMTLFKGHEKVKIALHVGPTYHASGSISGSTVDILNVLEEYVTTSSISATNPVASILALYPKDFSVGYSGFVRHNEHEYPVFKIEWI